MMKNVALFLVIIALAVGLAIYSHQRTQTLEQPAVEQASETVETQTEEVTTTTEETVPDVVETAPVETVEAPKVVKVVPKNFASDVEALEAYHLCKTNAYDAQKCINKLAEYNSRGFTLHVPEKEAVTFVTLPLADQSKISIHYESANILLGSYNEIKDAALEGALGDENKEIFAAEVTLLTPSE